MKPEYADLLERMANIITVNSGPLNSNHEGFNNLLPNEQVIFVDLLSKANSNKPLTIVEKSEFVRLKEIMRPVIPYNHLHPGFKFLNQHEAKCLQELNKKIA